jgi:hypothetical protein
MDTTLTGHTSSSQNGLLGIYRRSAGARPPRSGKTAGWGTIGR